MVRRAFLALPAMMLAAGVASAQSARRGVAPPVVASVLPPGGQVGTSVEWKFAGRGFAKVRQVLVSGEGVKAEFSAQEDTKGVASVEIARGAAPGFRELRLEGPDGVSNLVLVRIDTLPQAPETEPNDAPGEAQTVAAGSAVAGTIRATDVDHYRIVGKPGQPITLDFEARRLGTSIAPVLSVLNGRGASLAQARESRSSDHDGRLAATFPGDGVLIAQVRDNTYGGSESATYRLRVTTTPYATGMFPLGGAKGKPLTITVKGGNLKWPVSKTITLPDSPGMLVDPGPFESDEGPVEAPMRVMVGENDEATAATGTPPPRGRVKKEEAALPKPCPVAAASEPGPIHLGETVDGLIALRGQTDRYAMAVKKGEKFRIRVVAEPMGSWLDSVLTVRGAEGKALAENDDFSPTKESPNRRGVNFLGLVEGSSDSQVEFEAEADGPITIEVADRYGDGGPEYGYRLAVGASRPDFAVYVLIGNPNANGQVASVANNRGVAITPGLFGVYNLRPGAKVPVNFLVVPQGRPGPVTVRVEGLPEGVSAKPVKVEVLGPGPKGGNPRLVDAPPKAENVVLEVAPYASPGMGEFRIVATAEPEPGKVLTRSASATISLDAVTTLVGARPLTRRVERFPLRVVGEARQGFVGPPEEPHLKTVKVPGVLLQGDRIELGLEFDQSPLIDPGFAFEAKAKGVGLATNTVIASGASLPDSDDEPRGDVLVRVLASPRAVPGVYPVSISYRMTGGQPHETELSVIVRTPVELLNRADTIELKPAGSAPLWVGIRREVGCLEEVEVKVEGLPRGVKIAGPLTLGDGQTEGVLTLEMAPTARPVAKPTAVRVVASVRMPRGVVAVESRNRPMIVAGPAE